MDEIMEEIVELAKETGLDEVNVEDVEEIVPETTLVFLMISSRN